MKRKLLSFLILLFSFSIFSQSVKDGDVITVVKKMIEAQENYDAATLMKIYASDYIEISPKGEIDEREKAISFYKVDDVEKAKTMTPKYLLDDFNVRRYKNFAIVISKLSFGSKTIPQQTPVTVGRVVFALRKEKGGRKIYSAQFTPIPKPKK